VVTRRAEAPADQPFLLALFAKDRAEAFAPMNLPAPVLETLLRQQFDAQSLGYRAQFPAALREIVEVDGVPIGRLISDRTSDRLRLVDIALDPAWRGQRLGSVLIGRLMDEAREAGLPMALKVACDNLRATALYARLGFAIIASNEVYQEMRWTPPGVIS